MTTEQSGIKNEERLRDDTPDDRTSRAMMDRVITENREMTDADRIEAFRMQHFQHVLPDIPKIPGYHVCWLSTTSPTDTVMYRMRLGYEPIKREDIPGWDFDRLSLKTGEYAGYVGINEMLAFKIRQNLYDAYMMENHHDAPNRQDEKLIQDVKQIQGQAKSNKTYVESSEGNEEIEETLRAKGKPKSFD